MKDEDEEPGNDEHVKPVEGLEVAVVTDEGHGKCEDY